MPPKTIDIQVLTPQPFEPLQFGSLLRDVQPQSCGALRRFLSRSSNSHDAIDFVPSASQRTSTHSRHRQVRPIAAAGAENSVDSQDAAVRFDAGFAGVTEFRMVPRGRDSR